MPTRSPAAPTTTCSWARAAHDAADGGSEADYVEGGQGSDLVLGGTEDDDVVGGSSASSSTTPTGEVGQPDGADNVYGGTGSDLLAR